ncbi:MAG: isocitrate lyase/PEP mutase family protein [Pseudomonadota bacterium]
MTAWTKRRSTFRALMNGDRALFPASVFDPLSARLAEDVGFEIGMFAGSTASLTILGAPDYILITLSEFAEQARRITRASELPIMVDADHGYGNALNVARTVEELEAAGICGLSIEDTMLPEVFGADGKARMASLEEGVGKMRAAVSAKPDPDLVIAGRTSAPLLTDMDDCVARVQAYEAAGVDAIFVIGIKTPEQLAKLSDAVTVPLILGGVPPLMQDAAELGRHGVRICLQGHHTIPAAVRAIHETLTALRAGTPPADLTNQPEGGLMARMTRQADYDADRKTKLN